MFPWPSETSLALKVGVMPHPPQLPFSICHWIVVDTLVNGHTTSPPASPRSLEDLSVKHDQGPRWCATRCDVVKTCHTVMRHHDHHAASCLMSVDGLFLSLCIDDHYRGNLHLPRKPGWKIQLRDIQND